MPERVEIVETAALFADGQVLTALRPRDLLSLRFSLHDLEVLAPTTPLGPHRLRARSAGARLIVDFGPQHLVEDTAARQGDGSVTGLVAPMRTALASASRLVFQVPNGEVTPLTLAALLEGMQRWTLALPGPGPRTPTATETAIELPWRCVLAPFAEDPKTITWRHALTPGDGPYAPLWFTRLTAGCEARVITSPDHPRAGPLPHAAPTAPPLLASHRRELVTLTNSHGHARVDALALSSLGGWLDAEGRWPPTPGVDLVRWIHRVAAGRDQSVRTVERGYLYPLGHEAALITVSERTPVARAGRTVAALVKRRTLLIGQRARAHAGDHDLPFAKIEILTEETGDLDTPGALGIPGDEAAFWPRSRGRPYPFSLRLWDRDQRPHEASLPLIFVKASIVEGGPGGQIAAAHLSALRSAWTSAAPRLHLGRAAIAYAASSQEQAGDTHLTTSWMRLGDALAAGPAAPWRPRLRVAEVRLPALEALVGDAQPRHIKPSPRWAGPSAPGNAGGVYAVFTDEDGGALVEHDLAFGPDRAGGLANLSLKATGLARRFGPVADDDALASGQFTPSSLLAATSRLLGGVSLRDALAADVTIPSAQKAIGAGAPTPGPVPRLVADPSAGLAYLTWHARVVRVETPLFVFDPGPPASREPAELELRRQLDPGTGAPEDSVRGRLSSFSLGVPGLVDVGFSQLTFSHDSTGAGLDAAIDAVTFRGPLGLFDRLAGELGIGGSIEAGVEDGIAYVRARRSVPTLAVGVFELSNLELIAAYYLPLDERTSWLELAASSPARPFRVAVCGVGGDGHLALEVGAGGLQRFELGLGAAGGFALDVGVASGNVRMSIGVSYEWSASEGNTVSGSITLGGAVEVLGVVSVSITMTMGLAWEPKRGAPDRGSLHGRAQLDVKISILFFSAAVTLTVERRLAGADPPFTAQVSRDEWLAYAEAFA